MKMITRYAHGDRQGTAAAGVFSLVTTATNIEALFNLTMSEVSFGVRAYDAVTGQSVDCSSQLIFTGLGGGRIDNPGLVHTQFITPLVIAKTGFWCKQNMHINVSAGQLFTLNFYNTLHAVTANGIVITALFALSYLCPEDYLSLPGMDLG